MICPHCQVAINLDYDESDLQYPANYEETRRGCVIYWGNCPNCDGLIVGLQHFKLSKTIKRSTSINMDAEPEYEYTILKIIEDEVISPRSSTAPMPIAEMPEEIKQEYMEAHAVVDASPRAAAALLRLCVQKLMPLLGEKGKNINDDITSLVTKGLPVEIQQSLDILRVIGNESVHPGEINLNDDRETANSLFDILNLIVERMIVQPQKRKAIYEKLPDNKKRKN